MALLTITNDPDRTLYPFPNPRYFGGVGFVDAGSGSASDRPDCVHPAYTYRGGLVDGLFPVYYKSNSTGGI